MRINITPLLFLISRETSADGRFTSSNGTIGGQSRIPNLVKESPVADAQGFRGLFPIPVMRLENL